MYCVLLVLNYSYFFLFPLKKKKGFVDPKVGLIEICSKAEQVTTTGNIQVKYLS